MLDNDTNYIVSGLERSGTSLMMQMLHKGGLPVAFDDIRAADEHNPRGYYELEGGKIINRLMDGTFDLQSYRGHIIKVTAYGLKFLPKSNYKILYMMRNINEVLKSMHKMGVDMGSNIDEEKERMLFSKLNRSSLELLRRRDDMYHMTINYLDLMNDPREEMERVGRFFGETFDVDTAIEAVESSLYRNKASSG